MAINGIYRMERKRKERRGEGQKNVDKHNYSDYKVIVVTRITERRQESQWIR
jgi:hypothetical protein